jgi:excisionase family DNA binding protein
MAAQDRENVFIVKHYQRLAAAVTLAHDIDALEYLSHALMAQLGPKLEEFLTLNASNRSSWLRGAEQAANYSDCPPSRIYDLVARGQLKHAKDGSRLMFRKEWLDEAIERTISHDSM